MGEGREGASIYFDFFPVPDGIAGYVWDFPTQVKGQPMRCWGVYDANLLAHKQRSPLKEPLAEEMARHGYDLDDYKLQGHPIRWYSPRGQVSVPRVLLVGDAVGADGIFGEGISMALGYGKVAAGELAQAFSTGDFSFSGYKRRLARSALGQTLFVRWAITQHPVSPALGLVPEMVLAGMETHHPGLLLGFCIELGEENADLANCPGFHRDSLFVGNQFFSTGY